MNTYHFTKDEVHAFYDDLSAILADWEDGLIDTIEFYDFLVNLHGSLSDIIN